MSSLLRPVGHLPASVYWFRRALVLVVLVVLLVLVGRLFGGGGGDPQNSAAVGPEQTPSTQPTAGPSTTPSTTPSTRPSTGPSTGPSTTRTLAGNTSSTPVKSEPPKDVNCTGNDVRIDVLPSSRSIAAGASLNLVVQLSALRDECKAPLDPTVLSVTIVSGKDQIWTTTQCEQAIPRATLVLAKGKESVSTIAWNGRRSAPGCLPGQLQAKPGTYVAKAVYDGQASAAQAFQIN
jgi:hypothetical protein